MMSSVIRQETIVFALSVLHGFGLVFVYDLLRALRRAVPHGVFAVSAEDFLYWIAAGFLTFCLVFLHTDGVVRGYVAAGIGLGGILYHFTVSPLVLKLFSALFEAVRKAMGWLWRAVSAPAGAVCKFLKKMIEFAGKKAYNSNGYQIIRGNRHGRKKKTAEQEQP